MPTYDFECQKCRKEFEWVSSVEGRKDAKCPACKSGNVVQLFDKCGTQVQADILPYFDNGAGRWFHSRSERRAWMKGEGVEEIGNDRETMTRCRENLEICREAKKSKMSR